MESDKKNVWLFVWSLFYPIAIYFTVSFGVQFIYMLFECIKAVVTNVAIDEVILERKLYESANIVSIMAGMIIIPIFLVLYMWDKKKVSMEHRSVKVMCYILTIVIGVFSNMGFGGLIDLLRISELFPYYNEVTQEVLFSGGFWVSFISVSVIAPILEELLFRGLIHGRIQRFLNSFWIATLMSALLFGVIHGNMVQGIYAFLIAIILSFVYDRTGTIIMPILFHFAANAFSCLISEYNVEILNKLCESTAGYTALTIVSLMIVAIGVYLMHIITKGTGNKDV